MLSPEPRAAGAARHFVAGHLAPSISRDVADVAMLLTSELVTNAIQHAGTRMRVDVECLPHRVRVGVADDVPTPPRQRDTSHSRLGGRGMLLVAELARNWGVEPDPPGKRVWFELQV